MIGLLLKTAKPEVVYTQNLAEKHDTHVAVALKVIEAIRDLPAAERLQRLYGCEIWRDLDSMVDADKVAFDCSVHENLQTAFEAEPYSYCQFIMGRDHTAFGRARHPWLTGSGGWFYTAATRWMLGVRLSFDGMIIVPCILDDWGESEVVREWRGATFNITVKNPNGMQKGVQAITLNGESVECPIPPQEAGSVNEIVVMMG